MTRPDRLVLRRGQPTRTRLDGTRWSLGILHLTPDGGTAMLMATDGTHDERWTVRDGDRVELGVTVWTAGLDGSGPVRLTRVPADGDDGRS